MVGHRTRGRLTALFVAGTGLGLAEAGLAGLALLFDTLQDDDVAPSIVALTAGATTVVAAMVAVTDVAGGRRSAVAAAVVAAAQVAVAGVVLAAALEHVAGWRSLGLSPGLLVVYGCVASACGALAVFAAWLAGGRRVRLGALAATGAVTTTGAALAVGAAAAAATGADCDRFRFSPDRWAAGADDPGFATTSDRERIAATLVACGTLDGRTRAEVHAMLGPRDRWSSRHLGGDRWPVGWTGDLLGPGDGDELVVRYDRAGRVASVRRSYGDTD